MQSAFCLYDERLLLAKLITHYFPQADFAFLSACQTATGDELLSEEAVHLAAGMMMAGYRSVIATMWSIRDEDAPLVAGKVYSHLFADDEPDSSKAAVALHYAVRELQEKVGMDNFIAWVPYIQIGV